MKEQRVDIFQVKIAGKPISRELEYKLVDLTFTTHRRDQFRINIDNLGVVLGEAERIAPMDHYADPIKFDVLLSPQMDKIGEIYVETRTAHTKLS